MRLHNLLSKITILHTVESVFCFAIMKKDYNSLSNNHKNTTPIQNGREYFIRWTNGIARRPTAKNILSGLKYIRDECISNKIPLEQKLLNHPYYDYKSLLNSKKLHEVSGIGFIILY